MIQNKKDEAEGKLTRLGPQTAKRSCTGLPGHVILVQRAAFEHICSVSLSTAWMPASHLSERACLVIAVTKPAFSEVTSTVWDYFLQNGASAGTVVLCNHGAALLCLLVFSGAAFSELVCILSEEPLE